MKTPFPNRILCGFNPQSSCGRGRFLLWLAARLPKHVRLALTLLAAAGCSLAARGSGTVTNASLGSLNTALVGGGTVVCAFDGTITLTNTLTITQDTTLDGTGHQVTFDGNRKTRVFQVNSNVTLALVHVTLRNGWPGGQGSFSTTNGGPTYGGAVLNLGGKVNATDCRFFDNFAQGRVVAAGGSTFFYGGYGGAIANLAGTLNITNSSFGGEFGPFGSDVAIGAGCPPPGGAVPTGDCGVGQAAGDGCGGAIYNAGGTVTLVGVRLLSNAAGGGMNSNGTPGSAYGGAVYSTNGLLTLQDCTVTGNYTYGLLPGTGSPGNVASGGGIYLVGGEASVSSTAFQDNFCSGQGCLGDARQGKGGAVFNGGQLYVTDCIFSNNGVKGGSAPGPDKGAYGGAIYNSSNAVITGTTFSGNAVLGGMGGGFDPGAPGATGSGGAIYSSGSLAIVNCTLFENVALGGDGANSVGSPASNGGSAFGGAVCVRNGTLGVTNVTFAENSVDGGLSGSYPVAGGYSTNKALVFGGTIYVASSANAVLENTILVNSLSGSNGYGSVIDSADLGCTRSAERLSSGSSSGLVVDGGNNLSSDASCNFTNSTSFNNTDPVLGPLDNYGGPTHTMPLLAGSPAIDHGNDAAAPATDQRGRPRPFGAHSDIGAFESSPPYTIRGQVTSFWVITNASVAAGDLKTKPSADGRFALDGLTTGAYTVVPSLTNYLFAPANQALSLGPDAVGLDFKAYRFGALTPEPLTNAPGHVVFAGPAGTWEIDASTNLVNWQALSTNTIATNGLFDVTDTNTFLRRFYRAKQP
jgi:hypothetical protein